MHSSPPGCHESWWDLMRIHFFKVQGLITDLIDRLQAGLGRANEKKDCWHASKRWTGGHQSFVSAGLEHVFDAY